MVMHNPRAEMPKDAKLVPVAEGDEHGYWGQVPDLNDNEVYTAQGAYQAMEDEKKAQVKREAEWAEADRKTPSKSVERAATKDADEGEKKPAARRSSAKKED